MFHPEHGLVEARLRIVNQHERLAVRASVELVWPGPIAPIVLPAWDPMGALAK